MDDLSWIAKALNPIVLEIHSLEIRLVALKTNVESLRMHIRDEIEKQSQEKTSLD